MPPISCMADADMRLLQRRSLRLRSRPVASNAFRRSACWWPGRCFDAFLGHFTVATTKLKVGNADDPSTDIGPMVSEVAAERVMDMCEDALSKGARYRLQPHQNGATVSPGILTDVPTEARLWNEECSDRSRGRAVRQIEQALRLANDSDLDCKARCLPETSAAALRFSDDFEVGALWINEATRFRLDNYPFGGVKQSGVGREGVRYAIEEFSQIKFIGITV